MTLPAHGHELLRRVQAAAAGTPYDVEETEDGFDVRLDVADAQWFGLFNKAGLKKTFIHHVRFPSDGSYSITDESRSLDWVAGVPRLGASMERQYGRIIEVGSKRVYAFDRHGRFGVQAEYHFDSEEGRRLITGPAAELGLRQRRGAAELAGLVAATIALAGLAIGGVVVLCLWLFTDYFG